MNYGLSDKVRVMAEVKYIHPARRSGQRQVSIAVKDLMRDLQAEGFPKGNWPQICSALQKEQFLRSNGLEIEGVDGPPSKQSSTVVVRYRMDGEGDRTSSPIPPVVQETTVDQEKPEEWAYRVTEKFRGLLKEELAAYGGGEAFVKWVRAEDEDAL
jgi:hypothetical protein